MMMVIIVIITTLRRPPPVYQRSLLWCTCGGLGTQNPPSPHGGVPSPTESGWICPSGVCDFQARTAFPGLSGSARIRPDLSSLLADRPLALSSSLLPRNVLRFVFPVLVLLPIHCSTTIRTPRNPCDPENHGCHKGIHEHLKSTKASINHERKQKTPCRTSKSKYWREATQN